MSQQLRISYQLQQGNFTSKVSTHLPLAGITSFFGPSGCGKTSLLRILAGVLRPQQAEITLINSQGEASIWQSKRDYLPTWQRQVGFVFQKPALFPHLTVAENLHYAWSRVPKAQRVTQLAPKHLLTQVGICALAQHYPQQLSGGQQQRVALARTLAGCPQLMLCDEPLANLDEAAKQYFIQLLKRIQQETRIPILYVSHQLDEIVQLSDYLVLMEQGQIITQGAIADVLQQEEGYRRCQGENLLFTQVCGTEQGLLRVQVAGAQLCFPAPKVPFMPNTGCRVHFRAKDISLAITAASEENQTSVSNHLAAVLVGFTDSLHEAEVRVQLRIGRCEAEWQWLSATITRASQQRLQLAVGDRIYVQIKAVALSAY